MSDDEQELCEICGDVPWDTTCATCDSEICSNCESIEEPGACIDCEGNE